MARPIKRNVNYFPHYVKSGRTIQILQSKFGNDGYAFWFKLLELLCDTDTMVYDCRNPFNWEYLLSKTAVNSETACDILDTLAGLQKIDPALWKEKMIWVENLVNNVSAYFRRRQSDIPEKPIFDDNNPADVELLHTETPADKSFGEQKREVLARRGEEIRIDKNKEENKEKGKCPYQDITELWNSICISLPRVTKLNDERRKKIKCRLSEFGDTPEAQKETAVSIFTRVQASDFLKGNNKTAWEASFDWVFSNSSNWVKVIEGNYDNKTGRPAQTANLGTGEYIEEGTGRRTYGTGRATIPPEAPARPSDRYAWDTASQKWIML